MVTWCWWMVVAGSGLAIGYLLVAAVVGSHILVRPSRSSDRTDPAAFGWPFERIRGLTSADGVPIAAWWIPARDPVGPDGPAAVLVHGYADNKSGMLRYARYFRDRCNVVVVDLRGCGESGGRLTTQGIRERLDVGAVLDWLVRSHHPARVVLFGVSMGGETALLAASRDARVDAVILDSTHDRLRTPILSILGGHHAPLARWAAALIIFVAWLRTGAWLTSGDPLDHVAALGRRPLMVVHGDADELDPPECADRLVAAAQAAGVPVRHHRCPGAGHGATDLADEGTYATWINGFMRWIEMSPAPASTQASWMPAALASSASAWIGSSESALSWSSPMTRATPRSAS